MASVASQLIKEVTAHAQSDSLEDAREICADCVYFPNNLRKFWIRCYSTDAILRVSGSFSSTSGKKHSKAHKYGLYIHSTL